VEELWDAQELAAYLGVAVGTVYNWNYRGEGPAAIKVGSRLRWRPSVVKAWLTDRTIARPGVAKAG
jgi:excisionase family DNA binding protein